MEEPPEKQQTLTKSDLDKLRAIKVLGTGAMGTVLLVHDQAADPAARSPFALKVVEKSTLHTKFEADRRARWEMHVLTRLSHPFLPALISSFETPEFLAWAVPFCPGGDLNVLRHHQNDRVFSPSVLRFYLAEVACALEHLHDMGIVYRDLKPENILVQQSGHVTLTDFDLSRTLAKRTVKALLSSTSLESQKKHHRRNFARWIPIVPVSDKKGLTKAKSARVSPVSRRKPSFSDGERSNSFVGTEEYVSPEVVRGDGHEFAVDWWALGILSYEMLYGRTPFKGKNRKETLRNVLLKQPEFVGKRSDLTDLMERLLEKDPTKRLGYQRGACEIREHGFFQGVRWDLLNEVLRPPFIPSRDDPDSTEEVAPGGVFSTIAITYQPKVDFTFHSVWFREDLESNLRDFVSSMHRHKQRPNVTCLRLDVLSVNQIARACVLHTKSPLIFCFPFFSPLDSKSKLLQNSFDFFYLKYI